MHDILKLLRQNRFIHMNQLQLMIPNKKMDQLLLVNYNAQLGYSGRDKDLFRHVPSQLFADSSQIS